MASPMPMVSSGSWANNGQQTQQYCQEPQAMPHMGIEPDSPQTRLMGLKVSYTVDREAQTNYLARHPQPLLVQVVPLDEKNAIGIVDLRACVECVADCSPELIGQDSDYTVYAYDFSEPDQPLVGQGMLSWILEADFQQKIVIGRVTKNMLAALAGGLKETLEVKFKLTPSPRINRPQPKPDFLRTDSQMSLDMLQSQPRQQTQDSVMTPTGVAEWNSFVQSNLQYSQTANGSRVASPAPMQNHADFPNPVHHRHDSFSQSQSMQSQQPPQGDQQQQQTLPEPPQSQGTGQQTEGPNRVTPTLVDTATDAANPPSRPSSRASTRSRKRQPTGRPRGRPRKKQPAEAQGSTSGYEDGTDGEEGPARKKRATTVQVSKNINAPFGGGGGPESLRVAASTSGSLRNMRPTGSAAEATQGSHLQEVPRAPTPVPGGGGRQGSNRPANPSGLRRQSTLSQASAAADQPPFCELSFEMSPPSQDGRSPGDSEVATPMYSEDSPAAIGSSPPVPRTTSFMRSSPPASSPILPPMPKPQQDSGFMSGEVEEAPDETIKPLDLPPPTTTVITKPKRAKNPPKFPVRVFDLQLEQVSSEAELVPFHHVQAPQRIINQSLPPLQRSRSNTRNSMPPPPSEAGKEPSPQSKEQAVASKVIVEEATQAVSTEPAPSQPATADETDFEQQLLAQLQTATQVPARITELTAVQEAEEEVSLVEYDAPTAPTPGEQENGHQVASMALHSVPASDPVGMLALPPLPLPDATSFSEMPYPPSDALDAPRSPRSNKNFVKKESIRQRLQQAIESGEMPPYCHNCGAIETPTWRKIWVQEHEGVPETYEYSEKPGRVTAIIVLDREEDTITKYQIIKKGLAPTEDKLEWLQLLLCNPCGIWLCKWKNHRPEDRWCKDQNRLANGTRRGRKTAPRANNRSRSKKSSKAEPTSELNLQTDPLGFDSVLDSDFTMSQLQYDDIKAESRSREASLALEQALRSEYNPGSTHSRGTGTAGSPIALDLDDEALKMGTTRRLLFPSPRKDGVPKALSDMSINLIQTPLRAQAHKLGDADKENTPNYGEGLGDDDDLEALFRSPIARPSTPPPKEKPSNQGPFKTPTRPTPSHRPITRSISRSIRSARSVRSSEQLAMLQRTPTRTPRSVARVVITESPTLRRSPRLIRQGSILETPMTRSLNQLLSDAHDFDLDTSHMDFDLSGLPALEDGHDELIDFGSLLSTDHMMMPSSPPKGARRLGVAQDASTAMWAQFSDAGLDVDMDEQCT